MYHSRELNSQLDKRDGVDNKQAQKCQHHWVIPSTTNDGRKTITGKCRYCGAEKRFYQSIEVTRRTMVKRLLTKKGVLI